VKRPASGSDVESEGAVVVIEGVIFRSLISVVGMPLVEVAISGMVATSKGEKEYARS
jgi:hypothetical protein